MDLMCAKPIDFAEVGQQFGVPFNDYFADELAQIAPYAEEGLIALDQQGVQITPKGRLFVRAVGMRFDRYLAERTTAQYSKLI
jgi:oxygen-independent coproporphyrinogen III oxidase